MRLQKLGAFALSLSMFTLSLFGSSAAPAVAASSAITVTYKAKPIVFPDQQPLIRSSRTLVPIRPIAEALGFQVAWNTQTQTVSISKDGNQIQLIINQTLAKRNQLGITLDTPATIVNKRTVVPLRFIAEALSYQVGWNQSARSVTISDTHKAYGTIGATTIYQDDLDKLWRTFQVIFLGNEQSGYATQLYQRLSEDLVMASHLQATDAKNVQLADEELANYIQTAKTYARAHHYATDAALAAAMKTANVTDADLRSFARVDLIPLHYLRASMKEDTFTAYYNAHQDQFAIASVRHILVDTKEEAQAVIERLNNGASFAALASELSTDPGSSENGGLYSDVPVSQWVESFKQATLTQPLGKVGQPVQSEYGYHVILVESRSVLPFADVSEQIMEKLLAEQKEALRKKIMKDFKLHT